MNETEQKLLERAVKAETQAKFLAEALYKIRSISPFDKAFCIADAACDGYEQPKNNL
jgi:hypothetical protein